MGRSWMLKLRPTRSQLAHLTTLVLLTISLDQIPLKKISNAEMINLIGDQIVKYRDNPKVNDNQFLFDYLKKDIKEKRKMGHLTTLK